MPSSSRPTVNYQEHFQIDGTSRRRGNTNSQDIPPPTFLTNNGTRAQSNDDLIDDIGEISEETSDEEEDEEVEEIGIQSDGVGLEGGATEVPMDTEIPFDASALGLKEIGNLASWTVSSSKPGCGVAALKDDDTSLFWQSDGPQPHYLNIHFAKFAKIRAIRIFLDFEADESYTPTRITLLGGTGYHDLIPFSDLAFTQPKGWIDVSLDHVGGGVDGKTLRAFLVQIKVVENHQNGKDTHIRGLKIYAMDERAERAEMAAREAALVNNNDEEDGDTESITSSKLSFKGDSGGLTEPDWMGETDSSLICPLSFGLAALGVYGVERYPGRIF